MLICSVDFQGISENVVSFLQRINLFLDIQSEVANGFAMSLDKALEFASVYPEILNNAQV